MSIQFISMKNFAEAIFAPLSFPIQWRSGMEINLSEGVELSARRGMGAGRLNQAALSALREKDEVLITRALEPLEKIEKESEENYRRAKSAARFKAREEARALRDMLEPIKTEMAKEGEILAELEQEGSEKQAHYRRQKLAALKGLITKIRAAAKAKSEQAMVAARMIRVRVNGVIIDRLTATCAAVRVHKRRVNKLWMEAREAWLDYQCQWAV